MTRHQQPPLSPDELERYARHIVLPEIGGAGQQRLKSARVLVIGAGGLGAPVLQYLAAAGVGALGIVDDDTVSLSNLQRQIIHSNSSVGRPKVDSARKSIAAINPHIAIETHRLRIEEGNSDDLVSGHDVIVDGSDNFETRYAVADAAERQHKPLVSAAVGRFDGSLTVFIPWQADDDRGQNPTYRDLFPSRPPPGATPTCAEAGILGALTGVMGTLQAMEVIKLITGAGKPLIGRLLLYNALDAEFQTIRYRRRTA